MRAMALFGKSKIASALLFAVTAAFALAAMPTVKLASATQPASAASNDKPINFANQVVPIFTKAGCNGGGCHGKLAGQNGFRLSLLGFEPTEDYDWLVRESRGRRLSPAAPERSLLLLKATATLPHGGGKRLDPASKDYQLIVGWIAQGMPYGNPSDPVVASIEVLPRERTMPLAGEQQLRVVAHYSDGATEDVTESSLYDVNDKEVGSVSETGRFKTFGQPGEAAVMVRYQGQVAVFRATVPLGAPVDKLPPARNFVDELVFKKLKAVGMPPSDLADDATFLRRATLDIAGRLPTPAESTQFAQDSAPDKRDRLIDRLLDSGDFADYFANKWSALLRNKRALPTHKRGNYLFHDWIRDALARNMPYDQFVRAIVAAAGDTGENPPAVWYRQVITSTAQLEDTAQLFLGTRVQCAQCHHHPYERWSQRDYYSFSAFFSTVARKPGAEAGEEIVFARRGVASAVNKKDGQTVRPAGLGAKPIDLSPDEDPRQALVDWMVAPDNRFFAPALANRYWKHFFNRGLVDPEDDLRQTNPATNPELLDALSHQFIASGFDQKQLIRTICRSSTYQLSSTPNSYTAADKHHYSRYYPKRLPAEVLYDAVQRMANATPAFPDLPAGTRAVQLPDDSFNATSYFLTVFGRPDSSSACECERSSDASLAQSLHLFNSKEIQQKLAAPAGRAAALAAKPATADDQSIRELYALAYARAPEPAELSIALKYVARSTKDKTGQPHPADRQQSYEDLIWAMLNSKEFLFNH
jgi:hypothetical protein